MLSSLFLLQKHACYSVAHNTLLLLSAILLSNSYFYGVVAEDSNFVTHNNSLDHKVTTDYGNSTDPHAKPMPKVASDFKQRKCIESDLFCRTPDLLAKYGYPVETHKVVTRDGFVLVAHRIPGGRSNPTESPNRRKLKSYLRRPVILAHALLCSSSDWLMNVPDKALGYMLADAGLDVWIINSRGNSYSNEHLYYKDSESEYWDWSFHEMGTVDVLAWFDYVLNVTGHEDLYYVGHSMGTVAFFIGMSEHPSYNNKVRKMFALAPAVYIANSRYWLFAKLAPVYGAAIRWIGASRFVPETFRTWLNILGYGCSAVEPFCDNFFFFVAGYNPGQTNSVSRTTGKFGLTQTAIIASHTPDNVSSKTISHFLQIMAADRFQKYDKGYLNNGIEYNGQTTPPEYNLTKVTAPVIVFHSENDVFATPKDVEKCVKKLGNVEEVQLIQDKLFTHVDFTYAIDADKYIYNRIIDIIVDEEEGIKGQPNS